MSGPEPRVCSLVFESGSAAEGAVRVFPDFSDADMFLKTVYEITNTA